MCSAQLDSLAGVEKSTPHTVQVQDAVSGPGMCTALAWHVQVQDAVKEAALHELQRSIGPAAQSAKHIVGKALMSKLQPRVRRPADLS